MENAEIMQGIDPPSQLESQLENGSKVVTSPNNQIFQNDTVRDDQPAEQASSLIPSAAAVQDVQHGSNMDIDKSTLQEMDEGLDGVNQRIADVCQQIRDEEIVNHVQVSVPLEDQEAENMAVKNAKGDGSHSVGSVITQAEEGMDIQEDDILRTVIEVFEARHLIETRPIPVLVKGKEVDLVKLSFQVRACGGYDQVTLWSSVSKSLGFGPEGGPLLKLVYEKYLKSLERRRLIANQTVQVSQSASKEYDDNVKPESAKSQSKSQGISSSRRRTSEEGPTLDNNVTDAGAALFTEGSESLSEVLEWIKRLALNPGDAKKRKGKRVSRGSEAWAGRCATLAARMREILWKKHEHPLDDLSPSDSQDQEPVTRKRGRGQSSHVKDIGKKGRGLSS